MKVIKFKEQNIVFGKPEGWTDEQCCSLPAYWGEDQIISCWKLSFKERIKLLFMGIMWLCIYSNVQPPVYLTTDNPFIEPPHIESE